MVRIDLTADLHRLLERRTCRLSHRRKPSVCRKTPEFKQSSSVREASTRPHLQTSSEHFVPNVDVEATAT